MKKLSPFEQGNEFWSDLIAKLNEYMAQGVLTSPSIRREILASYNLTEAGFTAIQSAAKYEVLCFAAYCAQVAGSKRFIKLIRGFDRQSWLEFREGISDSMHAQVAILPKLEADVLLSSSEAADITVIHYLQTFTKGDPGANVPRILALDKSTLQETFAEFAENLEVSVRALTPTGEYPTRLLQWCPDAEYIYNCAAACADKK